MNSIIQVSIVSILMSFAGLGALYASLKGHMGYADAFLGAFILLPIYLVYLAVKDTLSYEYDWTDKEIAKMKEETEKKNVEKQIHRTPRKGN